MQPWPTITLGGTGEDVRTVQYLLGTHGHPVAVDAQYGPITRGAVQSFQGDAGLTADGVVGPITWGALIVTVSTGAAGPAVSALQSQLRSQGWRLAVDGAFGPQTDRSVRDLQTAHHLTVDGIAGPQTWNDVVGGFERLAGPEAAAQHLMDAWAADDRRTALRSATQAAVDLLLRGQHGGLTPAGCTPDPVLGPGHFTCAWTYPGGAVTLAVRGDALTGYYVESAGFVAD
ncbi:MAG: peptidoglycan-binding protein [Actinomycetales bacterium]|nr:peptidoglycan-binding protein [Actinomycetales bacterium]